MINLVGSALVVCGLVIALSSFKISHSSTTLRLINPRVDHRMGEAPDGNLLGKIARGLSRISPPKRIARLRNVVQMASEPSTYTLERVLVQKFAGAFVVGTFAFLYFLKNPGILGIVFIVIGTVGGYVVPEMRVSSRAEARQDAVRAALADAIDQLAVTVRAGLSVDSALVRVSETLRGPLAEELSRVVQDIQFGVSRSDALRALADRMDISELKFFVRALVQADSLGIPVATVLTNQAVEMRMRRRMRSEEKAMKLPVKILAPTLLCILPALMIIVLGPAVIQLMRNLQI
ncbi:MAG: type II secretion system F family protein [Ilumatobacteraceae bacterium]